MNPHIEYLKQLKAHGQTVVGIDYVLNAFDPERQQTNRMPPQRRFDKQESQSIIQRGWKLYEANTKSRTNDEMEVR
jgi:hypothetical protein